jgi:hypothetical protein
VHAVGDQRERREQVPADELDDEEQRVGNQRDQERAAAAGADVDGAM